MARDLQTAARPLVTVQTVLHYSAGHSSRSLEFFGSSPEKTLLQF
jgi:hypothetical protein